MQIQTFNGILRAAFCLLVFGILVLIGEYFRRRNYISGELARKFAHTTTGTWAALWPLFLDLRSIAVLAFGLTIVAIIFRFVFPLKSIYSVKRISIGEILIGLGLGASAWMAVSGSVYTAAVLVISWGDSMAAIIGTRYGKKNGFKVLGTNKSVLGSLAFFTVTAGIIFGFLMYEKSLLVEISAFEVLKNIGYSAVLAAALTVVEIVGVYGSDNLSLPIFTVILLNLI